MSHEFFRRIKYFGVALIAGIMLFLVWSLFSSKTSSDDSFTVTRGDILYDILASGKVEGTSDASVSFKNGGKIAKILVTTGDSVKEGQELLRQDTAAFDDDIASADASIRTAKARISQVRAGASYEQIEVANASLVGATTAQEDARKVAVLARRAAVDAIKSMYTSADTILRTKTDKLFSNPDSDNPDLVLIPSSDLQLNAEIIAMRKRVHSELLAWKSSNASLIEDGDIGAALIDARRRLELCKSFIDHVSTFVANANNTGVVLASGAGLDTLRIDLAVGKETLNTLISSVTSHENSLATAKAGFNAAESTVLTTRKQLNQVQADARSTDVAVYQGQLDEAYALRRKLVTLRNDLVIKAPFAGVITDVPVKVGEVAAPTKPAISIIANDHLRVKVNVVEDNIVAIKANQPVRVTFDANKDDIVTGTVAAIDPASKEINGTVYYQVTVELTKAPLFLRPGMTANVWFLVEELHDVVRIPVAAVHTKESTSIVYVKGANGIESRTISLGIKDHNGMVAVMDGLTVGEVVVFDNEVSP